jgi:hypothetical protein
MPPRRREQAHVTTCPRQFSLHLFLPHSLDFFRCYLRAYLFYAETIIKSILSPGAIPTQHAGIDPENWRS